MADVTFNAKFDDTAFLAAVDAAINGVNKLDAAVEAMGDSASDSLKEAVEAIKAATAALQAAGKGAGEGEKGVKKFGTGVRGMIKAITTATVVLRVIDIAVEALSKVLLKAKPITDAIADSMAALGGIINELVNRVIIFGAGLRKIFSGDIKGGMEDIKAAADNIGAALGNAARQGTELERALRKIGEQEEDLAVNVAKRAEEIVRLKAIQDDETKTTKEKQAALKRVYDLERGFISENIKLLEDRKAIADEQAEATKEQRRVGKEEIRDTEEQRQLTIQLAQAKAEQAKLDIDAARAQRALSKEAREAAKARREELAALQKQADSFLAQLQKLQNSQLRGVELIRAEREQAIKALDEQEKELRSAFQERGVQFNLEKEFEEARALVNAQASKEIRATLLSENAERQRILEAQREAEKQGVEEAQKERLKEIEIGKQILLARADLIERGNQSEERFAVEIARRKLQIEIDAARARLEVLAAQYGENSPEIQLAREQIKLLEKEYSEAGNISLSGIEALKQRILDALGISEEDAGVLLQGAGQAIGAITSLVSAATQAQISQQDKLIKAIQGRIRETEGLLRDEQKRAEQGYANNAALFEDSLKKQQAALEAAEREKAKLQEQAVKRQLRQNQLQAVSEYGLLVINLLARETARAGVVGIGIALGGLALIARIISQQKAAAAKLADPGFKDGTAFVDGPGTSRSDSISARLSKGERVLPADMNKDVGGRLLSNDALVRLVKLGRAVETGSFAPVLAGARAADDANAAMRLEIDTAINEKAYREASDKAADKIVKAIKGRPVVIPVGGKTMVETEAGGVRRRETYTG